MGENENGYAKKFHLYATAAATIVAMLISVISYMREMKDERAREQAGEGLNIQQKVIDGLQARVEFNSQLLLELHRSVAAADRDNGRGEVSPPESSTPRSGTTPREPNNPPPRPRLTPPEELFKKAPKIPKQEKRDWRQYEQRKVQ